MAPIRRAVAIPSSNGEERSEDDRAGESNHENTDIKDSADEEIEQYEDNPDDEDGEIATHSAQSKLSQISCRKDDSAVLSQVKTSPTRSDSEFDSDSDSILTRKIPKSSILTSTEKVESVRKKSTKSDSAGSAKAHKKKRLVMPRDTPRESRKSRKGKEKGLDEFKDTKNQKQFQRVWSDNDEIAVLRGMMAYASERGDDPYSHRGKFFDYIKNSLHLQVNKKQLSDKIRRLKKKFEEKGVKVRRGEGHGSPHAQAMFDLSSRIWGNHGSPVGSQEKGKEKILGVDEVSRVESGGKLVKKETCGESLALHEMIKYCKDAGVGFCEEFLRCGMENLGQTERLELEEAWNRINIMKSEVVLHMVKLVQGHIEAVLKGAKN